jgi:hypothetical protein
MGEFMNPTDDEIIQAAADRAEQRAIAGMNATDVLGGLFSDFNKIFSPAKPLEKKEGL